MKPFEIGDVIYRVNSLGDTPWITNRGEVIASSANKVEGFNEYVDVKFIGTTDIVRSAYELLTGQSYRRGVYIIHAEDAPQEMVDRWIYEIL